MIRSHGPYANESEAWAAETLCEAFPDNSAGTLKV